MGLDSLTQLTPDTEPPTQFSNLDASQQIDDLSHAATQSSRFTRYQLSRQAVCASCNESRARRSWGLHCVVCKTFVCRAACKRTLLDNGGCLCNNNTQVQSQSIPTHPGPLTLPSLAEVVLSETTSLSEILRHVTRKPAPVSLFKCPDSLETRYGSLLRDALQNHTVAEKRLRKHPTEENAHLAEVSSQMLWILTPAILRRPNDTVSSTAQEGNLHTNLVIKSCIRDRLQLAESGKWNELLLDYSKDLDEQDVFMKKKWLEDELIDQPSRNSIHQKVTSKSRWNNYFAAKAVLNGQVLARLSQETASEIDDLVCSSVQNLNLTSNGCYLKRS